MTSQEQILKIQQILGTKTKKSRVLGETIKNIDRHVWTLAEEELALKLYLNKSSESEIEIAVEGTALKLSSMKMKIQNIAFVATGFGLENVSSLTRQVYESYIKEIA